MRFFYSFLLCVLFSISSVAQVNLVPNPSFEDTLNCPGFQLFNSSSPWFNPTTATPDYYYGINPICGHSALNNIVGYQLPRTGVAYVGLFLWSGTGRDYIETMLLDTLKFGHSYSFNMYVSRSNPSSLATDDIGVYFSSTPIFSNNSNNLPVIPQVENLTGNFLIDSANWMNVTGQYMAFGDEVYLTIGNFKDEFNTSLIDVDSSPGTFNNSVYYVDDISLIDLDSTVSLNEIKNDISLINIFPNPVQKGENLIVDVLETGNKDIEIYNLLGEKIYSDIFSSKQLKINTNHLNVGLLLIKISFANQYVFRRILIK